MSEPDLHNVSYSGNGDEGSLTVRTVSGAHSHILVEEIELSEAERAGLTSGLERSEEPKTFFGLRGDAKGGHG